MIMKKCIFSNLFRQFSMLFAALLICQANQSMASIKIVCIGDSITSGSGTTLGNSYPEQLGRLLGSGYIVGNYGVSGRTMLKSGDNPYWITSQFTNSGNASPDIVVIMLGSNDAKPQNWDDKANYVPDYNAMIDHYRNLPSHPRVYINTCPTVYGSGNYDITDAVVTGEIAPLIRQIGINKGCPVIDVNAATKNMPQNFPDNVHPNDAGALVIAQTVMNGLMLNSVGFYQNSSYSGTASQALAPGNYTQAQLAAKGVPNDWASSARVPIGWTVTIYSGDNFSGTSWVLTSDNSNFTTLSPSANDQLSSCKIVSSGGSLANGTYK